MSHLDEFEKLKKTSALAAGVYHSRWGTLIERERLDRDAAQEAAARQAAIDEARARPVEPPPATKWEEHERLRSTGKTGAAGIFYQNHKAEIEATRPK